MATAARLASVLCLVASAALAQKPRIYDVRDLLADKDGRWPAQAPDWDTRLQLVTELLAAGLHHKNKNWGVTSEQPGYLIVDGDKDEHGAVLAALTDLRRGAQADSDCRSA